MHKLNPYIPVDRFEYSRQEKDGSITSVIYEMYANGREEFSEKDAWEIVWYQFEPTKHERQHARIFFAERNDGKGQRMLDMREVEEKRMSR